MDDKKQTNDDKRSTNDLPSFFQPSDLPSFIPATATATATATNDEGMDDWDYTEPPTLLDKINCLLRLDKKHDFVNKINSLRLKEDVPDETHELLFKNDAVNCLAAVLDGETDGKLNITSTDMGHNLIIVAANHLAPRICQLLLNRYVADDGYLEDTRPLTDVLTAVRSECKSIVSPGWSAFTLVLSLCEHLLERLMATVRVLAHKTKDINPLFFNYLKEGHMAEVAALLLVASEQLLPSSPASQDGFFGFKTLAEMNLFLSANKTFSSAGLNNRLIEEELSILVYIFDKLGDKLAAYVWLRRRAHYPIHLRLTEVIENAGFHLSTKYTGPCPFRAHSQGSHGRGSVDSETELVGECNNSIFDTKHLMPSLWMRNKALLPLDRKPDNYAVISRRLYHTNPSWNTNLACLAPVKRFTDRGRRSGNQSQFALLAAALKRGLRHV